METNILSTQVLILGSLEISDLKFTLSSMSSHFINLSREVIQSPVKPAGKFFPLVSAGFGQGSKKTKLKESYRRACRISFSNGINH